MFKKLYDIQFRRAVKQYTKDQRKIIPEGHLVMMNSGHRGVPYRLEEKRISRLLRNSGFLPTLEEVMEYQNTLKTFIKDKKSLNIEIKMASQPDLVTPARNEHYENRMAAIKEIGRYQPLKIGPTKSPQKSPKKR